MNDEERVRQRAYELWEQEGKPEGRENAHWEQACREIESEGGAPLMESDTASGNIGPAADAMREIAGSPVVDTDANTGSDGARFGKEQHAKAPEEVGEPI